MCRNLFLEPRQNLGNRFHISRYFIVADAHVDTAVPKPSDINVDLRIVHFLEFSFEAVHDGYFPREILKRSHYLNMTELESSHAKLRAAFVQRAL
jgi:hypothetical protein